MVGWWGGAGEGLCHFMAPDPLHALNTVTHTVGVNITLQITLQMAPWAAW